MLWVIRILEQRRAYHFMRVKKTEEFEFSKVVTPYIPQELYYLLSLEEWEGSEYYECRVKAYQSSQNRPQWYGPLRSLGR